jgi:8-oxo-dGTP diphosphatase
LFLKEEIMQEYVIVWTQRGNSQEETLLVLKDKPEWQKGRLNLPGGSVEPGETPEQAATRELKEETGYEPLVPIRLMGEMYGVQCRIYCMKAVIAEDSGPPQPRPEETQQVLWIKWRDAAIDSRLMANLRVIVPLIRSGVTNWIISDTYRDQRHKRHTIKVSIPTWSANAED